MLYQSKQMKVLVLAYPLVGYTICNCNVIITRITVSYMKLNTTQHMILYKAVVDTLISNWTKTTNHFDSEFKLNVKMIYGGFHCP